MDDDDTEGVLARLSRGVDNAMLRASPSEEDGAAESMLRTLLYEGQLPVLQDGISSNEIQDTDGDEQPEDWLHQLRQAVDRSVYQNLPEVETNLPQQDALVGEVIGDLRRLMEDVGVNYEPNPVEEMLRPRWRNARAAHRGDLIPTSTSADRRGADRPAPSAPANQRPPPGRASSAHRVPRRRLPSGRAREQRSAGPVPVDVRPPQWAKPYYKVVALVDGRPLSVYDGVTEYSIGQTIMHPTGEDHRGGLYVSPTVEGCLRRDMDMFPSESVLLGAPRAIAKVLAWNHTRAAEPVRYGTKLAFTYVRTAELLPYPASWPQNNDDRRVLQNQARPVNINEAEIRMPHHVRHDPSERIGPVSRTEALLRAQATTINLEEEVAKMERQLAQRLAGS